MNNESKFSDDLYLPLSAVAPEFFSLGLSVASVQMKKYFDMLRV